MTNAFYPILVEELSEEDGGGFLARAPDLYGCQSDGETAQEAVANAQAAIGEWCDEMVRLGRPLPEPGSAERRFRERNAKTAEILRDATSFVESAADEIERLRSDHAKLQELRGRLMQQSEEPPYWAVVPVPQPQQTPRDASH